MAYGFKDYLTVDYTQTGDDQLALNAKKRKRDSGEGTTEALTMAQRRAKSRQMKKYQARLKVGRSKARMRVASSKVLAKRARKQALVLTKS